MRKLLIAAGGLVWIIALCVLVPRGIQTEAAHNLDRQNQASDENAYKKLSWSAYQYRIKAETLADENERLRERISQLEH